MTKLLEMGAVTAYGIALQHGFVGTIQEWLDSLHARIGENGNWWVGDTDTGVLADPARLKSLTTQAQMYKNIAQSYANDAFIDMKLAEEAQRGAEAARERAEAAVTHSPMPNAETETWWVWDAAKSVYIDTGLGFSATDEEVSQLKSDIAAKITAPATASIGQTIRVSAVDDAGRPAEWEAADMQGEYELIEKIIVGYSITTEKPSVGWYEGEPIVEQDLNASDFTPVEGTFYRHTGATNYLFPGNGIYYYNGTEYQSYYTNTGTIREPNYSIVDEQTAWEPSMFFSFKQNGKLAISRNKEPDGNPYKFSGMFLNYIANGVPGTGNLNYAHFFSTKDIAYEYYLRFGYSFFCKILPGGKASFFGYSPYGVDTASGKYAHFRVATMGSYGPINSDYIKMFSIEGTTEVNTSSIVEVYGVRV